MRPKSYKNRNKKDKTNINIRFIFFNYLIFKLVLYFCRSILSSLKTLSNSLYF
jgi:hypothetical protein